MKKLIFIGLVLFFALSCFQKNTEVGGILPDEEPITEEVPPVVSEILYVYGSEFSVGYTASYETLMSACRRCGEKRYYETPSGNTVYQRFYGHEGKKCRNWNSAGYIQIAFHENKLPTATTVTIQPKYSGPNTPSNPWGEPFEVTSTANPINENEGFQILLHREDGLGGVRSVNIRSEYTNHVLNSSLDITVSYGQTEQTIISEKLVKLSKKAIDQPSFDCSSYTN